MKKNFSLYLFPFFSFMLNGVPEVPNWNSVPTAPRSRLPSTPLISGDTFRSFCTHIFDETDLSFNPNAIEYADTVFVRNDVLDIYFTRYHPHIQNAYILITHNGDHPVPGPFKHYLEDKKIIAWFTQNADCVHPKLYLLPIGLPNRHWPHGNLSIVLQAMQTRRSLEKRTKNVYLNFRLHTNSRARTPIWEYFKDQPFCFTKENRLQREYLEDMKECTFVISPPGNALDCHRTWEALYMGCIPIVEHSSIDPLFADLPVILIDRWDEVNETFLQTKYKEIVGKKYKQEKLFIDYWFAAIVKVQTEAKCHKKDLS